jgi:hypothetical protein
VKTEKMRMGEERNDDEQERVPGISFFLWCVRQETRGQGMGERGERSLEAFSLPHPGILFLEETDGTRILIERDGSLRQVLFHYDLVLLSASLSTGGFALSMRRNVYVGRVM